MTLGIKKICQLFEAFKWCQVRRHWDQMLFDTISKWPQSGLPINFHDWMWFIYLRLILFFFYKLFNEILLIFRGEYEIVEFTDTNKVELVPVSRLVMYGSVFRVMLDLLQRKKAVLVGYAAELYGVEDIFSENYVPNQ